MHESWSNLKKYHINRLASVPLNSVHNLDRKDLADCPELAIKFRPTRYEYRASNLHYDHLIRNKSTIILAPLSSMWTETKGKSLPLGLTAYWWSITSTYVADTSPCQHTAILFHANQSVLSDVRVGLSWEMFYADDLMLIAEFFHDRTSEYLQSNNQKTRKETVKHFKRLTIIFSMTSTYC